MNGFKHAFFTRNSRGKSPEILIDLITKKSSVHMTKQIHSNKVIDASDAKSPPWPEADAIVSNGRGKQSLWIYTADCIPILFADTKTGKVAAVHAGWKGIANGLLGKTISKMESNGSNKRDLIIALGPSISPSKYQVEEDVVILISGSIDNKIISDAKNKIKAMKSIGLIREDNNKGKYLLDIRSAAVLQLTGKGLDKNQISVNKNCTFTEKNLFHSWRRDKLNRFQWSVILSR
tara:strand:+ start:184 stop:885 length:702 start_codon:yes stop_codon:yes gene_type:complete